MRTLPMQPTAVKPPTPRPTSAWLALFLGVVILSFGTVSQAVETEEEVFLWPEADRAFWQDGPGLLLTEDEREALFAMTESERTSWIEAFVATDPEPSTAINELAEGIRRRTDLVQLNYLSPREDRARVLFLNGAPSDRFELECGQTFVALEIWTYGAGETAQELVFYKPGPGVPYRLWLPLDSKRVLYTREMEYYLEQYEELRGRIRGKRFDLVTCPNTKRVDAATGVDGLFGYREDRVQHATLRAYLEPPVDRARWSRKASLQDIPQVPETIPSDGEIKVLFPEKHGQRIMTRFLVVLPDGTTLGRSDLSEENDTEEWVLGVDGAVEQDRSVFDSFKLRYKIEPRGPGEPIALSIERPLRPERRFVVRLRIEDQIGGGVLHLSRGFEVPKEPIPVDEPPVPESAIIALADELALKRVAGKDSLLLVPPDSDLKLGLWRAEALVTGERISKVAFFVDGEKQLTRGQPPFSAELRLSKYPKEQAIRIEGYDSKGELVASDEVVLNTPRGALRVRIVEPVQGAQASGETPVTAEVVVPEDRRVEEVSITLNDETIATLTSAPWTAQVTVPPVTEVAYLTVTATLDDGSRAEAVRFLNAPQYLEEVEVSLVELFTTVNDGSGRLVQGLQAEDFRILEDGRPQTVTKFELVDDLPLTLGLAIDTSGSMMDSLPEAEAAALGFLETMMKPRDQAFAVSFAGQPELLIPPTDDVGAVSTALDGLRSYGYTALHDAVVTSLYYFRGIRGRRALVLLSDGDDTASSLPYRDALEYAKRSGVSIFTVGLNVGPLQKGIRGKLSELARETGGRVFFIGQAAELASVYAEIEQELRSQYLVAYASDAQGGSKDYREIEVKVKGGKLKARTVSGYYP